MANDEMDRAHREDTRAERDFRELARQINTVMNEHEQRLGMARSAALRHARDTLTAAADHIVAVWD